MTAEQLLLVLVSGFTGGIAAFMILSAIVYGLWGIVISAAIAIAQTKKER